MTFKRFAQIVDGFSYKPGWRISALEDIPETRWIVHVEGRVKDAYQDGMTNVFFDHEVPVRTIKRTQDVLIAVRAAVDYAEHHETDEWLVYNGKRPFSPHGLWRIKL